MCALALALHLRILLLVLFTVAYAQIGPECPRKCTCDYYSQVHTIDCSSQLFEYFPPNIPTWTTSLSFDSNFLTELNLTEFNTTTYFEKFRIRYNEIRRIVMVNATGRDKNGLRGGCARVGRIFPRLKEVNLRGNQLQTLPKCLLSVWPVLKVFNLNENELKSFKELNFVNHLYYYDSLEELYLRRNHLTKLSKYDLYSPANGLRKLKILDLSDNRMSRLRSGVFMFLTELRNLRLQGNRLRSIPDHAFVTQGQKIERIQLDRNKIDHIASHAFAGLPRLERLELGDNNIQCFTSQLATCPPLMGGFVENLTRRLEALRARSNYRATANFDSLRQLRAEDNPLHCDCSMKEFIDNGEFNENAMMSFATAVCATPTHFQGFQVLMAMEMLDCTMSI